MSETKVTDVVRLGELDRLIPCRKSSGLTLSDLPADAINDLLEFCDPGYAWGCDDRDNRMIYWIPEYGVILRDPAGDGETVESKGGMLIMDPALEVYDAAAIFLDGKWNEVYHEFDNLFSLREEPGEWHLFESGEAAGAAAASYWRDLAEHDPREFAALVGEGTLVAWGLGQSAGPGYGKAASLNEWLSEVIARHPEEHFGSYDGGEWDIPAVSEAFVAEFDFAAGVAYRHD